MIDLTPHSVLWVCVVSSVFIILLVIIYQNTKLISGVPMWLTVVAFSIIAFRMLVPIEFLGISKTYPIYNIWPTIYEALVNPIGSIRGFEINFLLIMCFIWYTVSAILLIYYIVENYRLCKYIKRTPNAIYSKEQSILENLKERWDCKFNVKLIINKAIPSPSEYGYFEHTIFLNEAEYTDEELEFILTHELFHFKYGTQWLKLSSELIWILFWWNPVIYIYKEHLAAKIEIYVDSEVTKNMPLSKTKAYLKTVFKVYYDNGNETVITSPFVGSLADSKEKLLKQRFELLSSPNKNNIPMCLAIIALTFTYLFISCRYIVQPVWEPPEYQTAIDKIILTSENSYIILENNIYVLYYNDEPFLGDINPSDFPDTPIK